MTGPGREDLANEDPTTYMDFPGKALQPGCDFETWERERTDLLGLKPTLYARVATEDGVEGLALQFWFWYIYNDWNNLHEGDWEMVQLTWDVSTVEEALKTDPVSVAMTQHGGAERREWDDERVEKTIGNQLTVFPSSGSHANYFGHSIWLGWTQNTGVGCDDTDPPSIPTDVEVILIPQVIDPDGEFSWLLWDGRWGERQPWEFNGPRGPSGNRWNHPVSWVDDARSYSIAMPHGETIGPGPITLFCSITEAAGVLLARLPGIGREIAALLVAILVAPLILSVLAWRYVKRGIALYARNLPVFLLASVAVFIVASLANAVQQWVSNTYLGAEFVKWTDDPSFVRWSMGLGLGGFQQLILALFIAPAIIHATYLLTTHDRHRWRESWLVAVRRLPEMIGAVTIVALVVALLMVTIALAPIAIYVGVRWLFISQAVIIDGAKPLNARRFSAAVVDGNWLRSAGIALLLFFMTGLLGPIIAMLMLVLTPITLNTADWISAIVYSIAYPVAILAATLFYLNRRGDLPDAIPEEPQSPFFDPAHDQPSLAPQSAG